MRVSGSVSWCPEEDSIITYLRHSRAIDGKNDGVFILLKSNPTRPTLLFRPSLFEPLLYNLMLPY